MHVRESALFVRPLAAGRVGGERLVGRHGADIDLLLADERARDRLISRDKAGEIRLWKPAPGRLELDRMIPRPANAPPSVFSAEPRWVHGHAWHDKKVRLWDLEALPGSRPLELRRSGSWNLAWPYLHPRGDWVTVFQLGEGRAAFWPLRRRYPSVVDGYTSADRPLAFSPDGRWLATTWAMSTKLRLWPLSGDGPREPRMLVFSRGLYGVEQDRLRSARPVRVRRGRQRQRVDRPARRGAPPAAARVLRRDGALRRRDLAERTAGRDGLVVRPGPEDLEDPAPTRRGHGRDPSAPAADGGRELPLHRGGVRGSCR